MSDQPQHVCCFHTYRTDTFNDSKVETAHCCDCSRSRIREYELVPMPHHGPRAPKVMQMTSERYVE